MTPEKLLVVDDDANNRDMLSRRLARRGYAVDVAENGFEAMEKIRSAEYDLVLLDQMMPGLSGLDLLHLLRATYSASELPVIMVTAVDQSQAVVEALSGGANDYVVKPVDMPVVTARIQAQIARSKADKAVRDNEKYLSLAARGSNDGLWEWNLADGSLRVSPRCAAMLGHKENEFLGDIKSWTSLIHPEDYRRVKADILAHLENRTLEFQSEYRVRNKAGEYQWMLARGATLFSGDGKPVRIAGSVTDISSTKLVDPLTGLGNRRMLLDRLAAVLHAGNRFCLVLLDLDGFKVMNGSFGHGTGDAVLIETGARLKAFAAARNLSGATISRVGGDEFALLIEDCGASLPDAIVPDAIATALLDQIPSPMSIHGFEIVLSASLGVVVDAVPGSTPEDLLRDADIAMYRAKECGRNRWEMFEPALRERAKARMAIVQDLRRAIELNQLAVFYQPKVHLKTRAIIGFEALMRWRHPERGLMAPAEFIPLAEETGLIVPLGEWILTEACRQLKIWQTKFPFDPPLSMNVNLSVKQLSDPNLVDRVCALLEETGIAPETLKLELTESSLITDLESARDVLSSLQLLRIGLKLDDFGTGYSSLSYLRALHFDSLKIDRSFVMRLCEDPETRAIVETIMNLARALDMGVVAEGIEEAEQLEALVGLGCEVGQGFLFSKPVEAAAAEQQLESARKRAILQ
ncbi:MAG TPA: EAL domain-containing protein [Bryobacteraceae bacterium]|nr:EAL domain-containing protein [Bryobacteraceae bacterium]